VSRSEPSTEVQSSNGRFDVTIVEPRLRDVSGAVLPAPASRWFRPADATEQRALADALGDDVVEALGGRSVRIAEDPTARALHHGACCVAANHVVTLLGQVERLAAAAGVPFEAYLGLARGALDNVSDLGPSGALTGPVVRGDGATIDRHRAAIDRSAPNERALYDALVAATEELARCR